MSTTPSLNGQVIGLAHYATRALLERELARTGTTFLQSVALNATADGGGSADRGQLVARLTGGLKIDEDSARAALAGLTDTGLLEEPPAEPSRLRLTAAGQERQRRIRDAVGGITARLYGDFTAEELAVAGRVVATVTARADAELAGG
ncbi:hypothetical protein GCM10010495_14740 [Kitasatospora herbaricolor]|uniref:hypothetical protein n=1 Tax=Kitasatospora herbaricolor TaxID=68217 RepID=UPI00174D3469|nr:hypothetical protein [Kitasatospora herbaricolor]MDQ0309279.1 hypothetical protein [Kitasatospora herbaricolor]GGV04118.1 hypothetical protein GCM10010495_14740 [Kitasatospora herbaricolor]